MRHGREDPEVEGGPPRGGEEADGTLPEERLIYFAEFTDLLPIIKKHWELFEPCLGDKKTIEIYMGRLEDFRNAPMHSRSLVDFEQKLIQGMTGEIRNKVTLFQMEANAADRHFPRIEFVRDSFGRQAVMESYPRTSPYIQATRSSSSAQAGTQRIDHLDGRWT